MNDITLIAQVIGKIASPLFSGEALFIIGTFAFGTVAFYIKSKLNV